MLFRQPAATVLCLQQHWGSITVGAAAASGVVAYVVALAKTGTLENTLLTLPKDLNLYHLKDCHLGLNAASFSFSVHTVIKVPRESKRL